MESLNLKPRQICDLEMLLVCAFDPLSGFLSQDDYENVLNHSRLSNNYPWPIPITLDVNNEFAKKIVVGDEIALCDIDNTVLAFMQITDKWMPDKALEAQSVFGTLDQKHPAVHYLMNNAGTWYLGGPLKRVQLPKHYDFSELRMPPAQLKKHFAAQGWKKIIGFQTRNPIHRAHMELTLRAARQIEGKILLHPVVGLTKPGDIDYLTRVRCYQKILPYYPEKSVTLSLLPLAMRMGGPREALWHAIIRKNYGCTHFIVGRDHAGPGNDSQNKPFYDPYAAQDFVAKYQDEIGIKIIPFQEMVYIKEKQIYCPANELKSDDTALTISGTQLRNSLESGNQIPDWFSFPEILQELRDAHPQKHKQGFTLFFTGLSGSGKSTIAQALMTKLRSLDQRSITILDGDVMRKIFGDKLGFSRSDRNFNIRIMSFVASEVTNAGGIAICAAIAPYHEMRKESREIISQKGGYIEIYIATPLSVCEERDTKALYAKVRSGKLKGFTGIDDPYDIPMNPDITIDTTIQPVAESVNKIINFIHQAGYLKL